MMGIALAGAMTTTAVLMNNTTANADTVVDDHTVQVEAGDTLSELAHKHGTSVDQLVKDNHIANANLIHVGDKIVVTPGVKNTTNNGDTTKNSVQNSQVTTNNNSANNVNTTATPSSNVSGGSVHDQFIAAGGNEAMWNAIVIPESGGNPNASNGQYRGLGQTNQSWGTGSVADQTQGMINYANSRYGSLNSAIQFRQSHGWW